MNPEINLDLRLPAELWQRFEALGGRMDHVGAQVSGALSWTVFGAGVLVGVVLLLAWQSRRGR